MDAAAVGNGQAGPGIVEVRKGCAPTATGAHNRQIGGIAEQAVLTTAVGTEVMDDFAMMTETELLVIDAGTTVRGFQHALRWNDVYHHVAAGH
jgi:L-arabinose isomerase